jgi:uncharacterized protein (TIGR00375 family)
MATSSQLNIPNIDLWARKKGISIAGTGDAVHPGWMNELKRDLVSAGNGLYKIRTEKSDPRSKVWDGEVYFMLTAEISCIYKVQGAVRKVHNIIAAPSFASMEKIQRKLGALGNIISDGRPILGLDSRDLLDITLEGGEGSFLFPAHIWTPWFSVLGSKSGFDTIEQCYRDLSDYVFAAETGLSSDPEMNRKCSFLDKYALVSNSDAHSPENLGREATIFDFDAEVSFDSIVKALKGDDPKGLWGTIEYFPQEGKYYLDGHRACGVCWEPKETKAHGGICPVCGKKVTVGVLNRICALCELRGEESKSGTFSMERPFHSLTGLKNIISEITGTKETSKKVSLRYENLLSELGSELSILLDIPVNKIYDVDKDVSKSIQRLRNRQVYVRGGYDGVYGTVRVGSCCQ